MSAPYTNLTEIQDDLVYRCRNYAPFATVICTHEDRADPADDVATALSILGGGAENASYLPGICIIWLTPTAKDELLNVSFGPLQLRLVARVLEIPEIYRAAGGTMRAIEVARRLRDLCKHYAPYGLAGCLVPQDPCIGAVDSTDAPVAYDVAFTAREADAGQVLKVATPTISPTSGATPQTITLACATAGAAIYYTTNGTNPGPVNGTLYSAPFSFTSAGRVRAGAYQSGYIPSDVQYADFT